MEKIYSKKDSSFLLHVNYDIYESPAERVNLSEENHFLQVSAINLPKERIVKPHKHLPHSRETKHTHEALIVMNGSLEVIYYDTDDSIICTRILNKGQCSVSFGGGHSFKVLEENTKVYELKNGPYEGRDKDYAFLQ